MKRHEVIGRLIALVFLIAIAWVWFGVGVGVTLIAMMVSGAFALHSWLRGEAR